MDVLAHRGLTGPDRPENTAAAVAAAVECGADGVEVDLRLTADGVLVASHDPDLSRVAGQPLPVAETRYDVLRALRLPGGHRVARLPELLDAVGDRRIVLELKRPPRDPGRTLAALSSGLRGTRRCDVVVSSFDPSLVAGVRALGLPVRTALLGHPATGTGALLRAARAAGHDEVHPWREDLLRRRTACRGAAVVGWTVDEPAHVLRARALGARAVITDDPVRVLGVLGRPSSDQARRRTG